MVDYSTSLPQLQSYQAPNMLALAQQMQQLQTGNLGLQEKKRDLAESNALRDAIAGNVDPTTPEGQRAIISAAPKAGPALVKTYLEMAGQQRQNQTAQADLDIKNLGFHRNLLTTVVDQPTYAVWRANTIKDIPKLASGIPETYNEDTKRNLMTTADKMVEDYNQRMRPTVHTFGETPYSVTGTVATPITVGAPAAAAGAPAAAAGAPAAAAGAPAAAAGAPAANNGYLAGLDRAEGRGKNPTSSAQGKFQFINSTFVDTAKKVFPELADKSPAEILALRGTRLQDGSQIEDALEQRFRADNIASLASAGIQPTPGNVYLAHFLGPGGARNVLGADPNTPISQLVDSRAIDANRSVLEGKTAGEVQAWAANKFGGQSGMAASMAAGNARLGGAPAGFVPVGGTPMSLGAPTVNNALMMSLFGNQAAPTNNLAMPAPIQMSLNPAIGGNAAAPVGPAPGTPISTIKPPEGFRAKAGGGFEFIPGGPADPAVIAAKQTATTTAAKTAENQVKAKENLPRVLESARVAESVLDQLIGKTKLDEKGNIVKDKNAPYHPGFEEAVGFSGSKWLTKEPIAGTNRADFETLFKQAQGGAFLTAYNILRGAGAITDIEGEKATQAQNAMNLATTEKAFIKAANDYRDIIRRGVDVAKQQASGGAAPAGAAAPATASVAVPPAAAAHLKANPGLRQAFDEKFGAGASASILGN